MSALTQLAEVEFGLNGPEALVTLTLTSNIAFRLIDIAPFTLLSNVGFGVLDPPAARTVARWVDGVWLACARRRWLDGDWYPPL